MIDRTLINAINQTRPETGPMQFGSDWPGIFIRGDNAGGYAQCLRNLLLGSADALDKIQVQGLVFLLSSCQIGSEVSTNPAPMQYASLTRSF
jgi:hypothetical protein